MGAIEGELPDATDGRGAGVRFAVRVVALLLASCGGGGGADITPAPPQLRSGPDEFLRCEVPQCIAIVREIDGAWKTNRYLQFAGREFAKVLPGAGLQTAKNPEGVVSHGPLHAQNCTSGTGALQTVSFRVRSEGFFATGIGDHLAFGLRANYPAFNALGSEQYEGIGTILHPKAMPRMAEPAGIAHCPGGDRRRDSPYRPELRNSLHWRVLQLAAGRPP